MRKFFTKPGPRFWIVLFFLLGIVFLILLGSMLWREPWVTPLPGVVLEPARPILKIENVRTDSAFDFLQRAAAEQGRIDMSPDVNLSEFRKEAEKLNLEPWSDPAFPMTLKFLDKSRKALELAEKAVAAGDPQVPSCTSPLDSFSYLSPVLNISKLRTALAAGKVAREDFDGAYADLNESIDFADILSRGSVLMPRLFEISSEINSLKAIRYIALQHEVPAGAALRTIRHLDEVDKATEPWAEIFRQECRLVPAYTDMIFTSKSKSLGLGDIFGATRYFGPLTGSSRMQVRQDLESIYAHFIQIAEKPYDPRSLKKMDDMFSLARKNGLSSLLTMRDPFGYLLAGMLMPSITMVSIDYYTRLVELRVTEAVLAIRQFEQGEKHPPAGLDELVPKYLSAVPVDPFDGKPLRYAVKPDGSWMVYSVGPNQIDEGGLVAPVRPAKYDMPGDLVYPSTEAAEAKDKAEAPEGKKKVKMAAPP